jgi:hypothetical protein
MAEYHGEVGLPKRERLVWIVSAGAALIAGGLFLFGLHLWEMMVPTPSDCPFPGACGAPRPPHHLHATRAEAVWLVSALSAFIAIGAIAAPESFRHLIGRGTLEEANQSPDIPDRTPAKGGRW